MSTHAGFPQQEKLVPSHELIVERIGWQFSTWGAFLLVFAAWMSIQHDSMNLRLYVTPPALLLGLGLLGYELRRRRNRAALHVRGPEVAVYRSGALATVAPLEKFSLFLPAAGQHVAERQLLSHADRREAANRLAGC